MRRIVINTVVKIVGEIYSVLTSCGQVVECSIRHTVKKNRVVVGDHVEIIENEFDKDKFIIIKVLPRRNKIPRPVISNIDKLVIVIASVPKPDLYLVDKLIVYCVINDIEPVLVVNKRDISSNDFINNLKEQYYFLKIFVVSARENVGIEELRDYLLGAVCAVSGQSAVGKSSILNVLMPSINLETQELSRKIDRGKHTTRVNQIFVCDGLKIADTPGFSNLELNLDYRELASFYPEFDHYLGECRYQDCSHIKEGADCAIVSAVKKSKINQERYDRYVELRKSLKEKWEKKYD